ncbi:hypothetical protein N657DRAFT_564825 [Parathielavia appendiculata]|uniref:Homeobox domain-containing protein n=1 Tax=Parathielavia appendiculata TaxID=2587402 RepID=A0AAN6U6J5_9PEZI|nr:hypothetical protein N657DRAFT_564825 [Parathielavia appendiculata]
MLVTRHASTEQSPWSISKFETAFRKSAERLRMSNNFDTVTQSDWQSQYSFLPPGDNTIFSQPYDHVTSSTESAESHAQPRTVTVPNEVPKSEVSPLGSRLDPLGLRPPKQPSPIPEQPETHEEPYPPPKSIELAHEESLTATETPGVSLGSNPLSSVSSAGQSSETAPSHSGNEGQAAIKEEEEEVLEDEEMVEVEAEGETQAQPQTAAERTAQRRKMKRFRLTHQQTRFLMSEFAKQPHPDAAHRERLSREIPGLSPRQVQVWFQNRRAKIKRLTADDRERMMKMRAVPEDFDSLSALHSPYGAVHGLGAPISSPVDLGASSYADHMMRPLMVDVRRHEGDDHLSPTGLSPAFGSIAFNPSAGLSTPDVLSPISPTSTDRYGYPGHLSTASLGAGPRTSNPFARQSSLDSGMQLHGHHSRQQIRPLQPLHIRDTLTRSRSDTLQSPLRSSMSWKGDAIDYTTYHGSNNSPHIGSRQHGLYQQDQVGGSSAGGLGGYDSSNYSTSTVHSPSHYSSFQSSSLQASHQRNSRLRAASASLPLGLDLRTQFRSAIGPGSLQASTHSPGPRTSSTTQLGGVSSSYTGSFPSAPLSAPVDFSLPRTPGYRTSTTDYSMPQMSAPIAPPNDFSQAFQASMSTSSTRTPMRDTFGGSALGLGQSQNSGERSDDFSDPLGMKRKRSFTGGSSATTAGPGAYGSTA